MHLKTFILFPSSRLFLILSYPGPSASSCMSCFLNFWSLLLFPGLPPRTTTWDAQPKVGPSTQADTFEWGRITLGVPQTPCLYVPASLRSSHSGEHCWLMPFGTHHHLQLPSHQASLLNAQLVGVQLIFPNSKKSLIFFFIYSFLSDFSSSSREAELHSCRPYQSSVAWRWRSHESIGQA